MPTCPKCGGPTWDGHQCPADAPPEPRAGAMRLTAGVLQHYVPPEPGGWQAMPLYQAPREYTVSAPGWWYVPREMEGAWHPERHDALDMRRWGREERAVALALLRCALRTLEEMED